MGGYNYQLPSASPWMSLFGFGGSNPANGSGSATTPTDGGLGNFQLPAVPQQTMNLSGSPMSPATAQSSSSPFGLNVPTGQIALGGLQTLSNIWNAFQMNKLARNQFDFTKAIGSANLANQIKSYNTNLTDRENSRAVVEGLSPDQVNQYVNQNQLTNPLKK